jgi:hypothetical protein
MTCIVGYKDKNSNIYLAGDRMAARTNRYEVYTVAHPKVFTKEYNVKFSCYSEKDKLAIGYTTSFRFGQLMEHCLNVPDFEVGKNIITYMVNDFVPALIDLFDKNFYTKKSDAEKMNGGEMLVGMNGTLLKINSDFSVLELTTNYTSCGCGQDYALSTMYTLDKHADLEGEDTVKEAIRTASKFSAYVDDNIDVIKIPYREFNR